MHAGLHALPRRLLIGAVHAYRLLLGAWLAPACRFEPTCSSYALEALDRHGAAAGTYLTLRRLGRCGPWCEAGHDPVPDSPWARAARGRAERTTVAPIRAANPLSIPRTDP